MLLILNYITQAKLKPLRKTTRYGPPSTCILFFSSLQFLLLEPSQRTNLACACASLPKQNPQPGQDDAREKRNSGTGTEAEIDRQASNIATLAFYLSLPLFSFFTKPPAARPLKALEARLLHTRRDQRAKDGGAGKLQHAPGARPCLSHLTCPGQQASKQARALKVPHGLKVLLTLSHIQNPGQGGGAHIRNERSGTDRLSTKDAQSTRSISSDIPHYVRPLKKRYRTTDMHASHQQVQSNLLEKHDIAPT